MKLMFRKGLQNSLLRCRVHLALGVGQGDRECQEDSLVLCPKLEKISELVTSGWEENMFDVDESWDQTKKISSQKLFNHQEPQTSHRPSPKSCPPSPTTLQCSSPPPLAILCTTEQQNNESSCSPPRQTLRDPTNSALVAK